MNIPSLIVLIILGILVYLIIHKMIQDKKNGKLSCGGNCSSCAGSCRSTQEMFKEIRKKEFNHS